MTGPVSDRAATSVLALIGAALTAAAASFSRRRRRSRLPGRTVIVSPRRSTVVARNGGVRSLQSAEIALSVADLEHLWTPSNLENLGRTYWRFLSTVTLGLVRVAYTEHERSVVLIGGGPTLLRFETPAYELHADHGTIRWRIHDGLLVARAGRDCGFLALDVRRLAGAPDGQAVLRIEVEVANFYPAIAAGFSMPVYKATQSLLHVLVTHAFLRSLATLELAESQVGRLAAAPSWVPQP